MDPGKGRFEMTEAKTEDELRREMALMEIENPTHGGWFRVGEILKIRGSKFRVKSVKPNELRLHLLPKDS